MPTPLLANDSTHTKPSSKAAAGPDEDPTPGGKYRKSILAVLGTLQIAGVLAGSGFIVKFAREDFLGVSSGNWDVSDLGMLAGSFGLNSATIMCQYVFHASVILPLMLILGGYVYVQSRFQRSRPRMVEALHLAGYVVLAAILGAIFRVEQAPTLYLHDFLITSPRNQPNISQQTPDYRQTNNLVRLIFGSRIQDDPTRSSDFPILKDFRLTPQSAYDVLNAQYARSLLICLVAWNFLFTTERRGRFKVHGAAIVAVFVLLLLVVTTMVPYTYGKLIHSTDFPSATVEYKGNSPDPKDNGIKHLEGPLLFQSPQTIAILWAKEGKTAVVYIPTSAVLMMRLHGSVDALTFVLGRQALPKPLPPLN
jgi:hypothetical protein